MKYLEVAPEEIPLTLLLEADPSEALVKSYLPDALCFAAKEADKVLAACMVKRVSGCQVELLNISVDPLWQAKGVGTELMKFVLDALQKKSVHRVELGTGTFGYQLTFYQRLGFRVDSVVKNYFLDHYPNEIFEHGIQHKDMLRLYLDL